MQPESNNAQRELAAQARAELDQPHPDWFRIKEIAERAAELTQAGATPARIVRPRPEVEAARARAEAMLEQVRPIVVEADGLLGEDNMARVCLDHAQEAYDRAVAAETAEVAIDGFRLAEESANAAHEHAMGLRAQAEQKLLGTRAAKLFWGGRGGR